MRKTLSSPCEDLQPTQDEQAKLITARVIWAPFKLITARVIWASFKLITARVIWASLKLITARVIWASFKANHCKSDLSIVDGQSLQE